MDKFFTESGCINLIRTVAAISVLVDTVEILSTAREYDSKGAFSWSVLRTMRMATSSGGTFALVCDALFRYPNMLYLVGLQLICAVFLLLPWGTHMSICLIVGLLLLRFVTAWRNIWGGEDGSMQMQIMIFAGLAAYYVAPNTIGGKSGIWFIALQAILAYLTAGTSKLSQSVWRTGKAIPVLMNTLTFGTKAFARVLREREHLGKASSWSVICFECLGPFLVFAGPKFCLVFIACAIIFHLVIAIAIGLNSFFLIFAAALPAVFRLAVDFRALVSSRHLLW